MLTENWVIIKKMFSMKLEIENWVHYKFSLNIMNIDVDNKYCNRILIYKR